MKIESIQVGLPKNIKFKGKSITTAIFKDPVDGPVMLHSLNLDGDKQAELSVHGGTDKALYAFSLDAYPLFKKLRPDLQLSFGIFGENLTIDSLDEDRIFIGDIFRLGEALVQVTEPRFPCYKLGVRFDDLKIIKQFTQMKRPGVYFRVLKEGLIDTGDRLELVESEEIKVSMLEIFLIETVGTKDRARLEEILEIESLPGEWRENLNEKLSKLR